MGNYFVEIQKRFTTISTKEFEVFTWLLIYRLMPRIDTVAIMSVNFLPIRLPLFISNFITH